jgi:hypothetical protein
MKYIYRISPAIVFLLGSFGHWQPAISNPGSHERMPVEQQQNPSAQLERAC